MSFRRENDRTGGNSSRSMANLQGVNYGFSKLDEPNPFTRTCDVDVVNGNLKLRPGSRKNVDYGYDAVVSGMFGMNIHNRGLFGVVIDGGLTVYLAEDVADGKARYYSWADLRSSFTWTELKNKTWADLVERNDS